VSWFSGQAAAVWLLALGQTLTYAGVYYAFPALLPDLQTATGWSVAELAFGPTLGFLVMAALTPFTGRWVDRGWGGEMLTYAPILAALGVAGLGLAGSPLIWWAIWASADAMRIMMRDSGGLFRRTLASRAVPAIQAADSPRGPGVGD